jgi:lambda family phage minor tail protein L
MADQRIVEELQQVAPSSVIELFQLRLVAALHGSNDVYRFHAGVNGKNNGGNVVWAGQSYTAMPIECDGFEYSGNGQLPRPKLRIANVLGTVTTVLLAVNAITPGNDLIGAKVIRKRTLARYLDAVNFPGNVNPYGTPDPAAEFPEEIYYISRKVAETRDLVELETSAAFDLQGVRAPKRQCIANICQWVYRSAECSYTEASYYNDNDQVVGTLAQDVCGKRVSSCKARFDPIQRTGSVTVGSATLTLNTTSGIITGLPIYGVGVASNATVSSITNSTTLVMSAAATASTTVSVSGTPSATAANMTVTSATGLLAGQTVTGTYIPSGTTIASISDTTLTLSARPYSFSRSGTIYLAFFSLAGVNLSDTSGITVGMRVFGSLGIDTTVFSVTTNVRITLTTAPATSQNGAAVNLYFMPASPGSATYSFSVSNAFFLRTTGGSLPFGSFPGIGSYTT